MKKLVTIIALTATVISAPALARTPAKTADKAPTVSTQTQAPSISAFDVYNLQGQYVGSDPDPRIRMMLLSESHGRA
jgi:hypothetical protein